MSDDSGSTSSEELDGASSRFNPLKALYSKRVPPAIASGSAAVYDNLQLFLSAQKRGDVVLPVGSTEAVAAREAEKLKKQRNQAEELEEKNRRRFTAEQGPTFVPRRKPIQRNVLTRCETAQGPLAALRDCMERRTRVKILTRHATGIRGQLLAYVEAFDKQWNLALSDVLEIWRRKRVDKRKVPPCMGKPCPAGTAAARAAVPVVTETKIAGGLVECTRHVPQLLVRGEHVVLVEILQRADT